MSGEELGAGASFRSGVRIRLLKRAVPPPIDYLAWRGASKEDVRPEEGAVEGEACASSVYIGRLSAGQDDMPRRFWPKAVASESVRQRSAIGRACARDGIEATAG